MCEREREGESEREIGCELKAVGGQRKRFHSRSLKWNIEEKKKKKKKKPSISDFEVSLDE